MASVFEQGLGEHKGFSAFVDGVRRYERTGIKVVVVGGGVGGLMAALECWRKGHEVEVVERADGLSIIGDAFTITPSALATLHKYPRMQAEYHENVYKCSFWWLTSMGESLGQTEPEWDRPGAKHPATGTDVSFIKPRPQFAKMLLDQLARLGIPIHWGRKVVKYEENDTDGDARVFTESGEVFSGEVVVAADGVGTKSHLAVTGRRFDVQSSGYAIARAGYSRSDLAPGSKAQSILPKIDERALFRVYLADDMHIILFLTRDFVGFAYTHRDDGSAKESWHHTVDPDEIAQSLQAKGEWDEAVIDFVKQCPKGRIVDWKLNWRDPQPQWASNGGRIIQLGDSAHAFLPTSGNGATQAIEDALSLAECLRVGGKAKATWSTKVHQKLRFQRVSIIQRTGFVNRARLHKADIDQLVKDGEKSFDGAQKQGKWMWGHNPEDYARDQYAAALDHLKYGTPFDNTNLPPGHVYEDWTTDTEMKREAAGLPSNLKSNGDWSV